MGDAAQIATFSLRGKTVANDHAPTLGQPTVRVNIDPRYCQRTPHHRWARSVSLQKEPLDDRSDGTPFDKITN